MPNHDVHSKNFANISLQLKQAFDPLCILNCDKVVRVQKPKADEVQTW